MSFQVCLVSSRTFWGLSESFGVSQSVFRCYQFLGGLASQKPTSPHSATFGSCPPPPPLGRVCLSPPSSLEISPRARDGARALLIVLSSARSSDQPGPKPELVPGLEWWDTGPLCGRLPCCCCCCCWWCCCWCSRTTISSQPTPPHRLPSTAWHVCLKLGLSRECSRDLKQGTAECTTLESTIAWQDSWQCKTVKAKWLWLLKVFGVKKHSNDSKWEYMIWTRMWIENGSEPARQRCWGEGGSAGAVMPGTFNWLKLVMQVTWEQGSVLSSNPRPWQWHWLQCWRATRSYPELLLGSAGSLEPTAGILGSHWQRRHHHWYVKRLQ